MNKEEAAICLKIYEENCDRISWYLRRKYGWLNEEDVNDVMQEVWKALSENIEKVGAWNPPSQWGWLATVASHQAATCFRRNVKKEELVERIQNYGDLPKKRERVDEAVYSKIIAEGIMRKLSQKDKEVLFGDILDPCDPTEKRRKNNAETCKYYRARKKLEKHMKEGGFND